MRHPDRSNAVARGVEFGIAAYLLWGFLTIYWKELSAFDAIELLAWRMTTAAVVMAIITTARGGWSTVTDAMRTPTTLARLLAAAALLAVNWGSYVWAVVNDRVIETALGYFLAPLVTMSIGVVVLKETPRRAQQLAFGGSAIAVVILTISYGRPPWIALVLATTWGLYGLAKRTVPLGPVNSLAGETFVAFAPAVVLLAVLSGRPDSVISTASSVEWAFVLGTGVITAVPLMLFAAAAKTVPFTVLGPLNLLVPVINFGLGWWLYGEPMPADRLVGFAFVWASLAVVMWDQFSGSNQGREVQPAR